MTEPVLAVEARGETKWFGETTALDAVDFAVSPGVVHGLLGPNGAGKTTLLSALFGLVLPDVQPETIPLTQGLTASSTVTVNGAKVTQFVPATPQEQGIPRSEWKVYEEWVVWSRAGRFNGTGAIQDWANPAQLNRLDWYSAHDWRVPYPGDKKILAPDQVPGHNQPADYLGD